MANQATSQNAPRVFPVTEWSVILDAGAAPSPQSTAALERLCQAYWHPLYAFLRRTGHSPHDAGELTQEFFARLLAHNWVAAADRDKGRFRSFLLMAMKRFLGRERDKANALKRGGGIRPAPLQLDTSETRYGVDPADTSTPEQLFEKQWALTLLETVLDRLRQEFARADKSELFQALEPCLVGSRDKQPYAELAAQMGMSEAAVKMAVYRLRDRYRLILKEEVGRTVALPSDVDEELRHLFRVLSRG